MTYLDASTPGETVSTMHIIRTLTIIFALAVMALPALSGPSMASDYIATPHPTAFRGLEWGAKLGDAPGLFPVQESGFKNTYFKRDEPMTLGKAELVSVAYYFKKDKLFRVGIAFEGRVNQFFLKDMLLQKYGEGRAIGFRYGWMWPEFSIELNYDNEKDTGSLYYTYEGKLD